MKRDNGQQLNKQKTPLTAQLILLYIFFYPMHYFAIRDTFGFSIGIQRLLFALIMTFFVLSIMAKRKFTVSIYPVRRVHLSTFLVYCLFSIVQVYCILGFTGGLQGYAAAGNSAYTSIFRSQFVWPIVQFISLLVSAVVPCIFIAGLPPGIYLKAARILNYSMLVLVFYGFIQFFIYQVSGIRINRMLLHATGTPNINFAGIDVLRIYSLVGEPKMYGTYLIGTILFYIPFAIRSIKYKFVVVSILFSLLMSFSTSAYLGLVIIVLGFAVLDIKRAAVFLLFFIFIIAGIYQTQTGKKVLNERVVNRIESLLIISNLMDEGDSEDVSYNVAGRNTDGTLFIYLVNLPRNIPQALFGVGYGNIAFGINKYMKALFDFKAIEHIGTRLLGFQILVENGLIGVLFFILILRGGLQYSNQLYSMVSKKFGKQSYHAKLISGLKYGFLGHFLSALIEVHYTAFIFLGLIMLAYRYYSIDCYPVINTTYSKPVPN